jgi:phosphoglycerate dehydrogenase-like enzyme
LGADSAVILTWGVPHADFIAQHKHLRYFGFLRAGYDGLLADPKLGQAFTERSIAVSFVPDWAQTAMAEFALGAALALRRKILPAALKLGSAGPDMYFGRDFSGSTAAILGFGKTGKELGRKAHALGAKILVHTRHPKPGEVDFSVEYCDLAALLSRASLLFVTCDLNSGTSGMLKKELLLMLPSAAAIINIARAEVFALPDLLEVLNERPDLAVLIDAFADPANRELCLTPLSNLYLTPHMAAASEEAHLKRSEDAVRYLEAFLSGQAFPVVPFVAK